MEASLDGWLWKLRPAPMAPWPGVALIQRDLLRSLRRMRPFVLVVLLMLAQVYWAAAYYPSGAAAFQQAGAAADYLFLWYVMITMSTGAILIPAAAGTSVVLEREQETYDLVRLTMLRRSTFFLAKALNAWGYFLLFMLASMPVVGVLFFLVGLEVSQVLFTVSIVFSASIALTIIGVACSCRARHTMRALVMAYGFGLFFMGGHILLMTMLMEMNWIPDPPPYASLIRPWVFALAPPLAINGIQDGTYGFDLVWRAYVYYGLLSLFFLLWGWRALHRADTAFDERAWRWAQRRAFRPIPDWVNPIAVKERRWSMGLRKRGLWTLLVFAHVYFLLISTFVEKSVFFDAGGVFKLIFGFALLCLLVPVLLVNTLTREKDLMNLDMLRMTMLSSQQIVLGKIWSGGRYIVMMLPGLYAITLAFESAHSPKSVAGTIMAMVTGCACLFFFAGLSVWIAARSERTASAMVGSYASGFAVGVGVPLFIIMTAAGTGGDEALIVPACVLSPFLGLLITLNDSDYTPAWLLSLVVFVGFGIFFFRRALRRYLTDPSAAVLGLAAPGPVLGEKSLHV